MNIKKAFVSALLTTIIIGNATVSSFAYRSTGWEQNTNGDWSYYKNGLKVKGWQFINNNWYYFNYDGTMRQNNILNHQNKFYYINNDGTWYTKPGWKYTNLGYWIYVKSNGTLKVSEWEKINGKWYYFSPFSGIAVTGVSKINNKLYYFNNNAQLDDSPGWKTKKSGNITYWYYIESNHKLAHRKWLYINKNWYYFDEYGKMANDGFTNHYYFNKDGIMQSYTGWKQLNNGYSSIKDWYFFDNQHRAIYSQWKKYNNKWYYFYNNGEMVSNNVTRINYDNNSYSYYYFDKDGVLRETEGWLYHYNNWYYVTKGGSIKTGWLYKNKKWYYFDPNFEGRMFTSTTRTINGKSYTFNENGELIE